MAGDVGDGGAIPQQQQRLQRHILQREHTEVTVREFSFLKMRSQVFLQARSHQQTCTQLPLPWRYTLLIWQSLQMLSQKLLDHKGFYCSSQKWQITYKFISDRARNADCAPYIHLYKLALSFGTFEYNLCTIIYTYSYNQYIFWESLSDEVTNPSYLFHPSNDKVLTPRDLFMSFQKAVLGLIYSISSITPIPLNLSVPQLPSVPVFSFHQFYHIY